METLIRFLFVVAGVLAVQTAWAQGAAAYPSKPIRMVVPFPPGASNDIMARVAAQRMSQSWGQPVVVENRPGANSIIGAEIVAKAPGDGHTVLIGVSSTYTVNPAVYPKLSYDPVRDLAPVTMMGSLPLVIAVNPSVPASTIPQFVALAKSKPGQLNYGTPTITFHVAVQSFSQLAGIQLNRVPYNGSVPTLTGLMGGHVQFVFMDSPPIVPLVKSGKLRALAVTSAKRVSYLPEVPTVAESGYPGYELIFWTGLFVPSATPRPIVDRLHAETARAMHAPENKERFAALGIDPVGNSPEEFTAYLRTEAARYAKVVKEANIRID